MLKKLDHARVCRFVEAVRGEQERLYIVSEHYTTNAAHLLQSGPLDSITTLTLAQELIEGLMYIHSKNIVSRNISLETILLTADGCVLLSFEVLVVPVSVCVLFRFRKESTVVYFLASSALAL